MLDIFVNIMQTDHINKLAKNKFNQKGLFNIKNNFTILTSQIIASRYRWICNSLKEFEYSS